MLQIDLLAAVVVTESFRSAAMTLFTGIMALIILKPEVETILLGVDMDMTK